MYKEKRKKFVDRKKLFSFFVLITIILILSVNVYAAVPEAPELYDVSSQVDNSARLLWYSVTGAESYNVYVDGVKKAEGVTGTNYVVMGLDGGTTYKFQVTAVNGDGESEKSNEMQCLIKGEPLKPRLNVNFNVSEMFMWAQTIVNAMLPVVYVIMGIALGFIVVNAFKGAFK